MTSHDQALLEYLQEFLTPERIDRFANVLNNRTRNLTVVLENLYQVHNASAVLRSCDAFGIQDVHIIEADNNFQTNKGIALGADRWLTIHQYRGADPSADCIEQLKDAGYTVAATVLHHDSIPVDDLPVDQPVAVMFGTEKEGLSETAIELADQLVHIPMHGFVESFNVSVAAALTLENLVRRVRETAIDWSLSVDEKAELELEWTRQSIDQVEALERRFHAREDKGSTKTD